VPLGRPGSLYHCALRIDPFDLSLAKRIASRKGIPFTQLMSMWLHENIEKEKAQTKN